MSEKMPEESKNPLEPVYVQTEPNQEIKFGLHEVQVIAAGEVQSYSCDVAMSFIPDCRLCFHVVPNQGQDPSGVQLFSESVKRFTERSDEPVKLRLVSRGVEFDVLDTGGSNFLPRISVVSATPPTEEIQYLLVHLFNFPKFISTTDYSLHVGNSHIRCGKVVLIGDNWRVTIVALDKTNNLSESLSQRGGHVITHIAKIERADDANFSSEAAEKVLRCLQHFLSFALARWAGLALPVGYSESGEKVFEQWGFPIVSAGQWRGGGSWFDLHHGDTLAVAFPGFWTLWQNELWHDAIRECLYWYVAANEGGPGVGIDTGLILCQTALEHLAWTYCVKDRKLVSGQAFSARGGLNAADKIRLLITSLGLPATIPGSLVELGKPPKHISGGKWDDAPHALTEIRNAIIHPDAKLKPTHGAYVDAWKLSLWLIELCLLRLIGFNGSYGNRLKRRWTGEVESVPWSNADAS